METKRNQEEKWKAWCLDGAACLFTFFGVRWWRKSEARSRAPIGGEDYFGEGWRQSAARLRGEMTIE